MDNNNDEPGTLPPLRGAAMPVVPVARTLSVLAFLLVCAGAVPSPEW